MNTCGVAVILFTLLAPCHVWAFGSGDRGTKSAGFLKFGVGARAVAMGEAYSAVADDASALYWNAAALTAIEKRSATFMHASGIGSSYFEYAAYGQSLGKHGALGTSFQYLSAGGITETDDATGTEVGTFTPYDLALAWGYAYRLEGAGKPTFLDGFSGGLAVKFIRSKLLDSDQTAAVDLGLLTPSYWGGRLRFAATAANMGGGLKFEQESAGLPLMFRLGGSGIITDRWTASMDVGFPNDADPFVGLGTECVYPVKGGWSLAGRTGFNSRTVGEVGGFTGFSFGVGLAYDKLSVDYGLVPFGSMGQVHRASVSARF